MQPSRPDGKEQRALEHKPLNIFRAGQAVQEAFDGVVGEDKVEILPAAPAKLSNR
jgi:hypothetical protein